jgi:co-chaperonin GroES (HSP10)
MTTMSLADVFRPIGEHVLVQLLPEKNTTPSGVVLPDIHYLHKFRRAVVLRVGRVAAARGVSPGQIVYFAKEHSDHGTEKAVRFLLKEKDRECHILKWYDFLFGAECPEVL